MQWILRLISTILVTCIIIILNIYCFVFHYLVDISSTRHELVLEKGRTPTVQEKDGSINLFCTFLNLIIRTLE